MKKKLIRIVIVDDHTIFLQGLMAILELVKEFKVLAVLTNGDDTLTLLKTTPVDVVITDISMPDMNGIELTKKVKQLYPSIQVLALTMLNEIDTINNTFKNGISGYVLKNTDKEELVYAIRAVACGETFFSDEIKTTLTENLLRNHQQPADTLQFELSQRELEILKLIASEYTHEQIAKQLFISPHTVAFHRKNLLLKLNVKNTAGLIKCAMKHGVLN